MLPMRYLLAVLAVVACSHSAKPPAQTTRAPAAETAAGSADVCSGPDRALFNCAAPKATEGCDQPQQPGAACSCPPCAQDDTAAPAATSPR